MPMNDHLPTRTPCSADSKRKAGCSGARPRSFRKAATGVWVSSMKESTSGSSRLDSAAAAIEHTTGGVQSEAAAAQKHQQVVEEVGGLLGKPLVGFGGGRLHDLRRLLAHLRPRKVRVFKELGGVGAVGAQLVAACDRPLQLPQHLPVGPKRPVGAEKAAA